MAIKTVYGIIGFDSFGNIQPLGGTGNWTVVRNQKGAYTVSFDKTVGFRDTPCVVLTEIHDGGSGSGNNTDPTSSTADSQFDISSCNPRSNACLVWVRAENFYLVLGDGSGDRQDRMVCFTAIGTADDD